MLTHVNSTYIHELQDMQDTFFNIGIMYKYYVQMRWQLSGRERIGDQKLFYR